MSSYIISYDLHKEGQNYECLKKKLKAYGTYWHTQRSVWIITTSQTLNEIFNNLKSCIDSNDKLFVGELSGQPKWKGYSDKVTAWLNKNL